MYRTDGNRVRGNDAMYELVPHIMPKRYDASNSIKVEIDLDPIQEYIRRCRKKGISMSHMSVIIAGYLRAASQNPYLNRFCMNKKIYARNHFCVSFVTLTPGKESDTVTKLYFNMDDTIFEVNRKVQEIFTALAAEKLYTKDEIMEWYLNTIYLGEGCFGVQSAARVYFGKDVSELTTAECASLIGITNNPSLYDPYVSEKNNRKRQLTILKEMFYQGVTGAD